MRVRIFQSIWRNTENWAPVYEALSSSLLSTPSYCSTTGWAYYFQHYDLIMRRKEMHSPLGDFSQESYMKKVLERREFILSSQASPQDGSLGQWSCFRTEFLSGSNKVNDIKNANPESIFFLLPPRVSHLYDDKGKSSLCLPMKISN